MKGLSLALLLCLWLATVAGDALAGEQRLPPPGARMPERWLPIDEQGWSIVAPAADSRLIYVSESEGNDETGQFYKPGEEAVGADPTQPGDAIKPFRTVAKAMAQAREGMPDWVMLKRGDVWWDVSISARSGRSPSEPSVICAYGSTGERPVIRGRNGGVRLGSPNRGVQNAVLMGAVLYCSFLDPEAPDYGVDTAQKVTRGMAKMGIRVQSGGRGPARNILVENCRIRFGAFAVQAWGEMTNLVLRRNMVLDEYPPAGHTMGMWGAYASVLLEECIFDHNGWLHQRIPQNEGKPGRANPLSHNTYCTGMYSTIFRDNMFLRAASIGNKFTANYGPGSVRDVLVDNNLYVDGEIGISMGGNRPGPLRWVHWRVTNNVMLDLGRSRPTGRRLAWYMGATDWDGGIIAGNLFLHQPREEIRNVRGLRLAAGSDQAGSDVYMRNVLVCDNVFHGLRNARAAIVLTGHSRLRDVTIADNLLQFPGLSSPLVAAEGLGEGVAFRRNTYWSGAEPDQWFIVGDAALSFERWVEKAGEQDARRQRVAFPEPNRCIETYMASLGMEPSIDAFVAAVRTQSKRTWRREFTAAAVNKWIRAGFGVKRFASAVPQMDAGD